MSPLRALLAIPLIAIALFAQDDSGFDIKGVVYEVGPNSPLPGAQVMLYQFDHDRVRTEVGGSVTDAAGAFQFKPATPGDYYVEVSRAEYIADGALFSRDSANRSSTGTLISLNGEHRSEDLRFALMRLGELKGKVVDEDGKPVPSATLELIPEALGPISGLLSQATIASRPARTGPDGTFRANGLVPGGYIVRISADPPNRKPPLSNFSSKDEDTVDQEFATAYWPGVSDRASASMVTVNPAGVTDLGSMTMRKEPRYRIHFVVRGCQPGDQLSLLGPEIADVSDPLDINVMSFLQTARSALPCGDLLFIGLRAASYRFVATTKHSAGVMPLVITNRNATATITLIPNGDVQGRVVMASGAAPPSGQPMLRAGTSGNVRPNSKGNFTLTSVQCLPTPVTLGALNGYYVKELRLDGTQVSSGEVPLCAGSRLDIVLDDKIAKLKVLVTDGDKPASEPMIFVQKARTPAINQPEAPRKADKSGTMEFAKLAPGEYQLLAVRPVALPDGENIQRIVPQLWDRATKVTIGEGEQKIVSLKLVDPFQ